MTKAPGLYLSASHPCSYLDDQTANTLLLDPEFPVSQQLYEVLVKHGFRRSGYMVYRPHCEQCQACVSVRIPVAAFEPNRSQQRTWSRNADLRTNIVQPRFHNEHFSLYRRYQASRHPSSSMDDPDPEKYEEFMVASNVNTLFTEMFLGDRLVAVVVSDKLSDGLSAIYVFYEPELTRRSLGSFAILWQIDYARRLGLDWIYLGYWIEKCKKMNYKTNFAPVEGFRHGQWERLDLR